VAWAAALKDQRRVARLIQCNAAHPYVFQDSLVHDLPQRQASQYIRAFRERDIEGEVATNGLGWFFNERFGNLLAGDTMPPEYCAASLAEWSEPGALTGMLNWYRASPMQVPSMDAPCVNTPFLDAPFPKLIIPVLVVWGMEDQALLPCQLDGLEDHIDDLTVVRVARAGHFVPWEASERVTSAMLAWLPK
jgi:pimeloyl-ACP methyl ester carboxylesterase